MEQHNIKGGVCKEEEEGKENPGKNSVGWISNLPFCDLDIGQ